MITLAAGLLGATALTAAEIKNSDCLECHGDKTLTSTNTAGVVRSVFVEAGVVAGSAHQKTSCASCHSDLTAKHPDDNIAARPVNCSRCHEEQALSYGTGVHGNARIARVHTGAHAAPQCIDCHGTHGILSAAAPASPLYFSNLARTCGQCHEQESRDVIESVHGQALAAGRRDAPTCSDCHSEHKTRALKNSSSLAISQEICSKCHASERLNTKYNLPADRVKTFFASYHGLAAQYGSTRAANCGSCHGAHKILPSTDPRSTIYKDNLAATCGQCHPGASAKFAQGKIHVDSAAAEAGDNLGERVNWWVRKIYLGMIFTVIGLMAAHNALMFGRKAAARARREERTVLRMDFSQRAQHFVLAFSFIVLALTGFALKFPDSWIARLLGSDEGIRRWGHRIAGVVLLLAGAYHVGYVLATRQGRSLIKDMMPSARDARDVAANACYLTGLAKKKPAFGRFGYAEKMEYWAVVWGTLIMGATGLMIWFKLGTTHWLPRWSIDVATTIHYYEAILACLAIVVWHFYHVIFDPDVYPLNRACVDGRVSPEWYAEEHALDARPANESTTQTQSTTSVSMKTKNAPSSITIPITQFRVGERAAWLIGGTARCPTVPATPKEVRRLVLLGAPGVGKGTQADLLHQWSNACHLSTGDIFRAAKTLPPGQRTPAMESAIGYMARGELVPDETVLALISERVYCLRCTGGFLLDGFPRTVAQAEALERLLKAENLPLTAVINYELPIDQIVERLAGRRICASCKGVAHVTDKLPAPDTCPHCGGKLYQREDDRPEAIRVRMEAYRRSTEPLIKYYRQRDLLLSVSAEGKPAEILQRTVDALTSRRAMARKSANPASRRPTAGH
jgi:formate dehydrogenase gamma subunit